MPRPATIVPYTKCMSTLTTKLSEGRKEATVSKIMSNLRTLHKKSGGIGLFDDLQFLSNYDTIMENMKDTPASSMKTFLSSALCALKTDSEMSDTMIVYQTKFNELCETIKKQEETNEKTEKQEERMVSYQTLMETRDVLRTEIDQLISVSKTAYMRIQAYMMLCIATMLPNTRRTGDFCHMFVYEGFEMDKRHNDDKTRNYYLPEFNRFVFNVYKGSDSKGQQIVFVPEELNVILQECLSYSPFHEGQKQGVPFLVSSLGNPMQDNGGAVQRMYESVGLNIGPQIIRNIVATYKDGDRVKRMKELEDTEAVQEYKGILSELAQNAKLMCHTTSQHIKYVRFDRPDPEFE